MQQMMGRMRAAMQRYEMIQPGERVAVGVSGGKDSLALLCALAGLREYYPTPFELVALTVDPQFGGAPADYSQIRELCRRLGVPFVVRRSGLGQLIFEQRKEPNPCSLCARMRRGMLHNMALEHHCGAIALGHHLDDAVHTFFMNLFQGGSIGCLSPKSYLSRKGLWLIRPMIFCEEKEVASVARRYRLPVVKSACPADGCTARQRTKELTARLEQEYPDLKAKVIGAMQRADVDGWGGCPGCPG